uniref:Uncharacterized protein n=1 Tax=Aureoumbra lagunensis TaxID=44058 RepID=A0A6S8CHP7_9STRA|mmetsp:Transcript_15254/g.18746  ORF Transcript_15254/g.18746 Transcript_15254/m.18746 type:complete len:731 (-) Transcript_15254:1789-3981(-)
MEGRTPIPSRQAQEVRRAQEKSQQVNENIYCIVSTKWWSAWCNYSGFDSNESLIKNEYVEPGPISNEPLFDERGMLRIDVVENDDYVVIPNGVWKLIQGWYGGGPAIKRRLLSGDVPHLEIHFIRVEVRLVIQDSGEPDSALSSSNHKNTIIELSRLDTIEQGWLSIVKATGMKEIMNTAVRVWVKPAERDHFVPATGGLHDEAFWRRTKSILDAEKDIESWSMIDTSSNMNQTLNSLLSEGLRWGALVECKIGGKTSRYAWPRDALKHRWRLRIKSGDIIDAKDSEGRWFDSVVRQVKEVQIHVHFRGWAARWDTWVDRFDEDSIQPLFTHTTNWRKFKKGDACEIRSEEEKRALWYEARVLEVYPSDDPKIKDDYVLVQAMIAGHQTLSGPSKPRKLSTQSESLAKMGTHIKRARTPIQQSNNHYLSSSSSGKLSPSYTNTTQTISSRSYKTTTSRFLSQSYGRPHHKGTPPAPGAVGLSNLGNTCFMNSMLQCLSHTKQLREYFLNAERVQSELNEDNPLGSGGNIARAYADFISDSWSGDYAIIVPTILKKAVGQQASQFLGYQQQDSQEFMSYLLDGLHEDLNRVRKKPYIETLESNGRPDQVVANESWDRFQLRNKSIIIDTFYGLLRSHITCPNCGHESITFDPYNTLSLPLPSAKIRRITITLSRADGSRPTKYLVQLSSRDTITQLKQGLARISGETDIDINNLDICDIWSHRIQKCYKNN